jgi:hypothetical protein
MKITIEQYEHKIIHEVPHNDVDLDEVVRMIEGLLKATGYVFSGNLEIVESGTKTKPIMKQIKEKTKAIIGFISALALLITLGTLFAAWVFNRTY